VVRDEVLPLSGGDSRPACSLQLTTDEATHRVDLLDRNIRRYGTIYNTLAATCEVYGNIAVRPPVRLTC
jgi:hypothetical protein